MKHVYRLIQQLLARVPEAPAFSLIALMLTWCVALWLARAGASGGFHYDFLPYNLALALIPLLFSTAAVRVKKPAILFPVLACWLVFFPNAPYLLTDLIHLRPRADAPFWFDWIFLVSCAGAGFYIGLVSLRQIHHRVRGVFGKIGSEICLLGVIALTGFGIYLGRFPRWNSWDIAAKPLDFAAHIAGLLLNPLDHPRMLAYSFGVTFMLAISWLAFRCGPALRLDQGDSRLTS